MKMTNPLAKLVRLLTATVIIASLEANPLSLYFRKIKQNPTGKHYDESRYNLRMP